MATWPVASGASERSRFLKARFCGHCDLGAVPSGQRGRVQLESRPPDAQGLPMRTLLRDATGPASADACPRSWRDLNDADALTGPNAKPGAGYRQGNGPDGAETTFTGFPPEAAL